MLNYPRFRLDRSDQDALLAGFLPPVETVEIHATAVDLPKLRDQHERVFLLLPNQPRTRVLVTSDSDLQAVRSLLEPTRTMTAAEFLEWLDGGWTFP